MKKKRFFGGVFFSMREEVLHPLPLAEHEELNLFDFCITRMKNVP